MRVPNMKVRQSHVKAPDASIFTTTIFEETLPSLVAAHTTAPVDLSSPGRSFRFGAVGRRPLQPTATPSTPDHNIAEQTTEAQASPPEDISDPEKRQVQAPNPCPSGLQYIKCSDGSFEGCGNKNICAINSTTSFQFVSSTTADSRSTRRTTTAPTSTAPGIQTSVRASSTSTPSSTATDSSPTTTTSPSSSKPSVGGIAGGAVGGILALLAIFALLIFLIRRHRRTVDKRRAASLPTNNFPPKSSQYRDEPHHHTRSMSTANDVFAFVGKAAGGLAGGGGGGYHPSHAETSAFDDKKIADQRFPPPDMKTPAQQYPSPGLRAEGGPGLPPAAFLRPVPMLDGREIFMIGEMGEGRPRSVASGRSRFREEGLAEMEDTSRTTSPPTSPDIESPILGHPAQRHIPSISSTLSSPAPRKQHLMSWSTYSSRDSHPADENIEMSATLTPKQQPGARVSPVRSSLARSSPPGSAAQVSPLPSSAGSGEMLGSGTYVVSPLRKDRFRNGKGRGG